MPHTKQTHTKNINATTTLSQIPSQSTTILMMKVSLAHCSIHLFDAPLLKLENHNG